MENKGDCILTFFGCFSPPTNGHLCAMSIAYDHMKSLGFNVLKCIMIPAHGGYSTLKPGLMDAFHRVAMCRFLVKNIDIFEVDSVEADKDHWSRTIDTLGYLQQKYPNVKIMLICGIDTIDVFETKWREPDVIRILLEFGLVVLSRGNDDLKDIEKHSKYLPGRTQNIYKIPQNPLDEVSSTLVRNRISRKENVYGLISSDIVDYIHENHLYEM